MNTHKKILLILSSLLLYLCSITTLRARELQSLWSTDIALPGERILLFVISEGRAHNEFEIIQHPRAKNASVRILPYRRLTKQNGSFGEPVFMLPLLITPDSPGQVELSPIALRFEDDKKEVQVPIPPLKVYSTSEIKWFNNPIPYGVLWDISKKDPYVNESITARMKLLLPKGIALAKLPSFTTSGLKIFPFDLSTRGMLYSIHKGILGDSGVPARGVVWDNYDLTSTIIPYREGKNEASGKCIISRQVSLLSVQHEEILLPTLSIPALPLPPGEPAHFDKLVGDYQVSTSTEASKLAMNETIDVTIRVTGAASGSLDNVPCPRPIDEEGWKLVPASKKVDTDINGRPTAIIFHQLIRPTREQAAIPSFRLSYFNPKSQQYDSSLSNPIVLPWEQSDATGITQINTGIAAIPPAGVIPVAEMSDIYSLLPEEISAQSWRLNPRYYWLLYLPAALIALYLLLTRVRQLRDQSAGQRELDKELRELQKQQEPLGFLRHSAAFVEKHLPSPRSPELEHLIHRRDEEAFQQNAHTKLSEDERKTILTQLRRGVQALNKASKIGKKALMLLLTPLLLATASLSSDAQAQGLPSDWDKEGSSLYEKGQYSAARDAFERGLASLYDHQLDEGDTSAARLYYHLGNSYYRLNQAGPAALAYARALEENPSLKEAARNLAFIQRKQGAIRAPASTSRDIFTYLDAESLQLLTVISTAILLTSILLLYICTSCRLTLKILIGISSLASLLCAVNWLYYYTLETPDLSTLEPSQLAYVITTTDARSAADEKGSSIIKLPASTPLRLLARRPSWDYIECMNGVRGWVPKASIQPLAR